MLQCSAIKLQTQYIHIMAWLQVGVTTHYSLLFLFAQKASTWTWHYCTSCHFVHHCAASTHRLIATRGSLQQCHQQMKTPVSCGIAYDSDWCSASPDIELLVLLLQAEKVWTGINIHTYIHSVHVASIYVFVYATTLLGSVYRFRHSNLN